MKKPSEDKLIQYAFGELNEDELLLLEARLEREEDLFEEVEVLREIRQELKQLNKDLPPCKLSFEKVRDVILQEGLLRKKRSPRYGFFFVSAFAAAVGTVFLFVVFNFGLLSQELHPESPAAVALREEVKLASNEQSSGVATEVSRNDAVRLQKQVLSGASTPKRKKGFAKRVKSLVKHIIPLRKKAPRSSRECVGCLLAQPNVVLRDAIGGNIASQGGDYSQVSLSNMGGMPRPVVVVTEEQDYATGAHKADEIKADSQVIISG
jgi:hypothetical protein